MRTTSVVPGDIVADRRLLDLLGTGGEGEVWLAIRPDGSHCALKLVRPEVLPDPEEVRRRGQWLVRIDHPSLVRVSRGGRFTTGPLADWGFVEMDLVGGPSLQTVGPVPDALERLEGVAEALDLLHAGAWSDGVPLVHRDVKPGNLISASEGLVLVDPSTMRGLDTRDLTRVGTPAYLAPEVMTGRFGPLVDVYSLAATAAALLTGRRGHGVLEILTNPWDHDLPEGVCAGLEPDPGNRPGTCAAVLTGQGLSGQGLSGQGLQGVRVLPHVNRRDRPGQRGHGQRGPRQNVAPHILEAAAAQAQQPGEWTAPRPAPGWTLAALALVSLGPSLVWALRQTRPTLVGESVVIGTVAAALAVHLLIHLVTRRPIAGLLAPPWAWGSLIAGRRRGASADQPGWRCRRVLWLADVTTGTIVFASAGIVAAILLDLPVQAVPGIVAGMLALIALWRRLVDVQAKMAWAPIWTLTLPLRIVAAVPRRILGR